MQEITLKNCTVFYSSQDSVKLRINITSKIEKKQQKIHGRIYTEDNIEKNTTLLTFTKSAAFLKEHLKLNYTSIVDFLKFLKSLWCGNLTPANIYLFKVSNRCNILNVLVVQWTLRSSKQIYYRVKLILLQ